VVARQTFGWWWLSFRVEEALKGWIGGSQLVPCNRWLWGNLFLLSIVPNLSTKWRRLLRQTTWQEGPYLVISIVGSQHCDDLPYRKGGFSNYICTCECLNQTQAARFWKIGEKLPCSQLFESSTSIGSFAWIAAQRNGPNCSNFLANQKVFLVLGKNGEALTRRLFWEGNDHPMNAGGDRSWRCGEVWFATLFLHLCFLDDKRGVGWLWFTGLWILLYVQFFLTLREDSKPFVVLQLGWDREYHLHTLRHHTYNKFDHEGRRGLVICDILMSHLGYKLTKKRWNCECAAYCQTVWCHYCLMKDFRVYGVQSSQISIPYRYT